MADQALAQSGAVKGFPGKRTGIGYGLRCLWSAARSLARDTRAAIRRHSQPPVFFMNQKPEYRQYEIGEWTYGSPQVLDFGDGGDLKIGRFCSIAGGATILLGGEHRYDWVTTYPFNVVCGETRRFQGHPRSKGPVIIGNDVWIGLGAMILSGVTIGDGAVVAARSQVTKSVPPYAIVAGNPAQILRHRFNEDQVAALLQIRWWEWPIERIREAWPLLLSDNIDNFIRTYSGLETVRSRL